jgi:hypothetical protein
MIYCLHYLVMYDDRSKRWDQLEDPSMLQGSEITMG